MTTPPPASSLRELAPNSFIFEKQNALPDFLCDNMVARFEQNLADQYAGRLGQNMGSDQSVKKTTDIFVSGDDKPHWKDVDNNLHRSLALALREFRELYPYFKGAFKDMGYNLQRYQAGEYYHWHIEIIPKLTRVAGFEWGTGFYINPVTPEDASQYLKEIEVK